MRTVRFTFSLAPAARTVAGTVASTVAYRVITGPEGLEMPVLDASI